MIPEMEQQRRRNITGLLSAVTAICALTGCSWWSSRQPLAEDFSVVRLAVSKSGERLAAATASGRVIVWKLDRSEDPIRVRHSGGPLNDIQFSPDERRLAIADRNLILLPLDADRDSPLVLRDDGRNYGSIRFSPARDTVLTITGSGLIQILNATTGGTVMSACCSSIADAVEFSSDGLLVVSAGHLPRIWDARSGELVSRLTPERESMRLGPIALRNRAVLMGSQDGSIRIWDLADFQVVGVSPQSSDWVDTIAVQEQTGLVAYAAFGWPLRVWNPETNRHYSMDELRPSSNIVFSSPDGPLVAGLADGTVEFWDIQQRQRQALLRIPRNS